MEVKGLEMSFGLRGVLVAADNGLFSTGNYVEKVSFLFLLFVWPGIVYSMGSDIINGGA